MRWWMDSIGIDGFRCDVAGEVPTDFWNWAMADIRKDHPDMFTLAEDEAKAQELTESAFDMYYGWELHHLMNGVAQGKNTVEDLWAYFAKADTTVRANAIRMNFTSNHDENSWNGTEQERMGAAAHLFAAFTYIVPGMPLIYTGQLSGNHHRLEFFEKDCIDRVPNAAEFEMYKKLNALRKANKALWSPEMGAPMVRIPSDSEKVFACARPSADGKNTVIAFLNMSPSEYIVNFNLSGYEGEYTSLKTGEKKKYSNRLTKILKPWEVCILTK